MSCRVNSPRKRRGGVLGPVGPLERHPNAQEGAFERLGRCVPGLVDGLSCTRVHRAVDRVERVEQGRPPRKP